MSTRWGRRLRGAGAALVVVAVAVTAAGPPPVSAAPDGALVTAAIHVLEQRYVEPVQPVPLLDAAIAVLRISTTRGPDTLPDLAPGTPEAEADRQFAREFSWAAQGAPVPEAQLERTVTEAMVASLHDSHTYYLDPDQLREAIAEEAGHPSYTGIGVFIVVRKDDSGNAGVAVETVIPGSPAARAGVQAFDRLASVDGVTLQGMTAQEAVQLLRGPRGSVAALVIARGGRTVRLSITRAPIRIPPVEARMVAPGVAYAKIYDFAVGTGRQLRSAILALEASGPLRGIILDLRGDPGGLLVEAEAVAGVFLPHDTVIARVYRRGGSAGALRASGEQLLPATPLAVLVDQGSASSSEIVASALANARRAALVGEKTAGALGGATRVALPDGGMSVTTERILTSTGAQVEGVGVTPDTTVPLTAADIERGQDTQLAAALRILQDTRRESVSETNRSRRSGTSARCRPFEEAGNAALRVR